jgi:hypothetical protein
LIDQFLQIAERKVVVLDEYGDENWGALDAEILRGRRLNGHYRTFHQR